MNAPFAATLATLVLAGIYVIRCLAAPWSVCARCNGRGDHDHLFGGRLPCRRCNGSGRMLRPSRRILNRFVRLYLAARERRQEANR